MLRTTLVYVLGVSIALGILLVSLFAVTFRAGRVRGAVSVAAIEPWFVSPTPTPVNYRLPYPGLLPDSPFWFLKAIRDRFVLFFAWDPKSKIEEVLLLADKRLAAAEALINGGKESIGVSTAIKGEKYLQEAVNLFLSTKGLEVEKRVKLETALAKHKEVIKALQERSPELNNSLKEALETDRTISDTLR